MRTQAHFQIRCIACDKVAPRSFSPFCSECNSMNDVFYDLETARLRDSENPYVRFMDLLPVRDPAMLPEEASYTPCVHAKNLGGKLGLENLYLKDETVNPTGSTKDRMAAIALPYLVESGVNSFCTSSTGNSSTAFAMMIRNFPELQMFVFTAEAWSHRVHYDPEANIVPFVLKGATFVEAFECAGRFAQRHHITSERGFFNPGRREGLKLAFMEATDQIPGPIDWYVQAVSSAMGVMGTHKAAKELKQLGHTGRVPSLLCVQQESCSPMARAFAEGAEAIGSEHVVKQPSGIAEAILRGDPTRAYPYVRGAALETGGSIASVSEQEIREARAMVEEYEGLTPCFSAATALAGLAKQVHLGTIDKAATIMVNLTGKDREFQTPSLQVHTLERGENDWQPEAGAPKSTQNVWDTPSLLDKAS
ncbi:MAG: pyridoxal-5'-phosphate-dependent protein subunit beta [Spirochaeta sp.]|nr:pyridoxal-5'-phosphate-dependent protein subunit beta [Spirochaeta sp.]RPG03941.1 MAG: pyridoxal-phosphate dependent enzyme [Proteobacteria bacterium TMED72]